jgi:hypothetical protein
MGREREWDGRGRKGEGRRRALLVFGPFRRPWFPSDCKSVNVVTTTGYSFTQLLVKYRVSDDSWNNLFSFVNMKKKIM